MRLAIRLGVALLLAVVTPAQAQTGDEAAIRAVIETFRTAIIAKDKVALNRLPASDGISFLSAIDPATLARVRQRRPEAKRLQIGSYAEFVAEITTSKVAQEEIFSNITIRSDGSVAAVTFDYDFRENGVVTNSGLESWGMVHGDDGWKIASIIYSASIPEKP